MIYRSIDIEFIKDEFGKSCIVPDINKYISTDIFKDNTFLFYLVRQLNKDGVPNGLYLKDISKLRTPEQNAISKYKFQSINVSFDGFNKDPYLVRLKPGDKLELPEYTKNQKEYACFENLMNRKAELVAVFKKIPLSDLNNPESFSVNYTNPNGIKKELIPTITKSGKLFYKEIQDDLNNLLNTVDDFSTQYLFCGQFLTAKINKNDYRKEVSIVKKTITNTEYIHYFYLKVKDNEYIDALVNEKLEEIRKTKTIRFKGILAYKNFSTKSANFRINEAYLDEEYEIPLHDKINISPKFNKLTIYLKANDINFYNYRGAKHLFSKYGNFINVQSLFADLELNKHEIENAFKTLHKIPTNFSWFKMIRTSTKEELVKLHIKDVLNNDYEITYSYPININILGRTYTFDFTERGFSYSQINDVYVRNNPSYYFRNKTYIATDITPLVNDEKNKNIITSKIICVGGDFVLEQYKKDKYLLVFDQLTSSDVSIFESIKTSANNIDRYYKVPYKINGIDLYIVDYNDKIVLEKYHSSAFVSPIFCGNDKALSANAETQLYGTTINYSEISQKYKIRSSLGLALSSPADICDSSVIKVGDRYIRYDDGYFHSNIPCYRNYYNEYSCFYLNRYYVPTEIIGQTNNDIYELSFWDKTVLLKEQNTVVSYDETKMLKNKYFICIFATKK